MDLRLSLIKLPNNYHYFINQNYFEKIYGILENQIMNDRELSREIPFRL